MTLILKYKLVHDAIYKKIDISDLACSFIDTSEFQRLRDLHQLGTCYLVFPCAKHTRFEHSIGVYYLCGKMLNGIKENMKHTKRYLEYKSEIIGYLLKIPELVDNYEEIKLEGLTDRIIELVKIGGLCHDIGHGPFSHVFDDTFISGKFNFHPLEEHENRSCLLIEYIVKKYKLKVTDNEVKFIQNLISPKKENVGFIYQVVSNYLNGIDVDKFDYIARDSFTLNLPFTIDPKTFMEEAVVINNNICFPEQCASSLKDLFHNRLRLHETAYSHKTVVSLQYMLCDIFELLESRLKIAESIFNMEKYCKMTDKNILSYLDLLDITEEGKEKSDNIKKAQQMYDNIKTRKLYKRIGEVKDTSKIPFDINIFIKLSKIEGKPILKKEDYIVHSAKLGYVSGNKKNPLKSIYLYNRSDFLINNVVTATLLKNYNKTLIPENYQEHLLYVFCKNREVDVIIHSRNTFIKMMNPTIKFDIGTGIIKV